MNGILLFNKSFMVNTRIDNKRTSDNHMIIQRKYRFRISRILYNYKSELS